MDLNKVQIIWNVTTDIEMKSTPNWNSVVSLSIATNRVWKDNAWQKQEQAEFHNIVLWGKLAEIAEQYCKKGNKVYIEWRLQTRSWEAQDGTKRYRTEIVWENMILLWWKRDDNKKDEFEESDKKHGVKDAKSKNNDLVDDISDIPF